MEEDKRGFNDPKPSTKSVKKPKIIFWVIVIILFTAAISGTVYAVRIIKTNNSVPSNQIKFPERSKTPDWDIPMTLGLEEKTYGQGLYIKIKPLSRGWENFRSVQGGKKADSCVDIEFIRNENIARINLYRTNEFESCRSIEWWDGYQTFWDLTGETVLDFTKPGDYKIELNFKNSKESYNVNITDKHIKTTPESTDYKYSIPEYNDNIVRIPPGMVKAICIRRGGEYIADYCQPFFSELKNIGQSHMVPENNMAYCRYYIYHGNAQTLEALVEKYNTHNNGPGYYDRPPGYDVSIQWATPDNPEKYLSIHVWSGELESSNISSIHVLSGCH